MPDLRRSTALELETAAVSCPLDSGALAPTSTLATTAAANRRLHEHVTPNSQLMGAVGNEFCVFDYCLVPSFSLQLLPPRARLHR